MKRISFFLFFLITALVYGQSSELEEVRGMYYHASENSGEADKLYEKLKNQTVTGNAVLYGYRGMSLLLKCHHSYNPYNKLKYFAEGKNMLEEAIVKAPDKAELRFLRFSVQTNAPGFLNYSADIHKDKEVLLNHILNNSDSTDTDLYKRIKDYLLSCKFLSDQEKQSIKNSK